MSLVDLHVELSQTNQLLIRIAEALERLAPVESLPEHSSHPLIGLSDISRMTPEMRAALDGKRANMAMTASSRVLDPENQRQVPASVTGSRDHEDPLDTLDELDLPWENYAGGI